MSIVVARKTGAAASGAFAIKNFDEIDEDVDDVDGQVKSKTNKSKASNGEAAAGMGLICHTRSKSAPAIHEDGGLELPIGEIISN